MKDGVTFTFAESLSHNFSVAMRLMEGSLTDCPDELWRVDLWPNEAPTGPTPVGGLHGSAPWFLGYHALSCLDYDLNGDFESWVAPPPIDENTYGHPNRVFTKQEVLGYVSWCRERVRTKVTALTEENAARQLPDTHRQSGIAYGVLVGSIPGHVIEHASQIRQFLTASGVKLRAMPGDRAYLEEP